MFPATINVTPKSPSDLANASAVAASIDRRASGKVTRQNNFHSDAPRFLAARSYLRSTLSKAALADFTNKGKEWISAATTAAFQVNTSGDPKIPSQAFPKGLDRPSNTSR